MNRRDFIRYGFISGVGLLVSVPAWGERLLSRIVRSDKEWRRLLSTAQYRVLRREGTEPSWSSPLNDEKRRGIYHCAGCDLSLFTAEMKYESGSGWPSFTHAIAHHLETKNDHGLMYTRTEYHCARCGGHQGHIFDDGPPPEGKRYCNNGVALVFRPANNI